MRVVYRVSRGCVFCGSCQHECPVSAITMTDAGAVIDEGTCVGCGRCYDNCVAEAIARVTLDAADKSADANPAGPAGEKG